MKGVFVAAVDTAAGKTMLACLLVRALEARGVEVCVRKPVESACKEIDGVRRAADAHALAEASKRAPHPDEVCPYRFAAEASPARAMALENQSVGLAALSTACRAPDGAFLLVEGAGGLFSPICAGALNVDLALALKLPAVLVAEDRLGCLSQTLSVLEAADARACPIVAVVLNKTRAGGGADLDNAAELRDWTSVPVFNAVHDAEPGRAANAPLAARLATMLTTGIQ